MKDLFEKARTHERLEQLNAAREHDLLPYFREVDGEPGPVVEMEGRERITLGSNNYLGLTTDPRVKQAAQEALDHYGTGLTGSRFMNGTTPLHLELERELADWTGAEDALVFTTGYQANVGCIATLLDAGRHRDLRLGRPRLDPRRGDDVPRPHPAVPPQQARQAGEDARALREDGGGVLVVVDGVFSMEGDLAPLPDIVALCREHGARLLVDEAHGVGVLGETGTGACEEFGVADDVDLRMGTFSKSLASCGGFIAGPAEVIDFLRVQARAFMFTASAVPAAVGAALGALRVIRSDEGRELLAKVLDNARYLQAGLDELGFDVVQPTPMPGGGDVLTPIVPVTDRRRLAGGAVLEGPLRRGRLRERRALPRGAARGSAPAHERHGHPREGPPGSRPRGLRPSQGPAGR